MIYRLAVLLINLLTILSLVPGYGSRLYEQIELKDCEAIRLLDSLGGVTEHFQPLIDGEICHWRGPVNQSLIKIFTDKNINFKIVRKEDSYRNQKNTELNLLQGFDLGSYKGHFYLEEIYKLTKQYISRLSEVAGASYQIDTIGFTRQNRPLIAFSIEPSIGSKFSRILITSLMHARESATATSLLYYLYTEAQEIENGGYNWLKNSGITVIPVYNPDGYALNQEMLPNGGGLIRKNVYYDNGELIGTDLNRNWGPVNRWEKASTITHGEVYRGPTMMSEPETRAIDSIIAANYYDIQVHLHSFSNVIVQPEPGDMSDSIADIHNAMGAEIMRSHKFSCGEDSTVLNYKSHGDIVDYMTLKYPNAIVVLPELGNQMQGFWPEIVDLPEILNNGRGIIDEYVELLGGKIIIEDYDHNLDILDIGENSERFSRHQNIKSVYYADPNLPDQKHSIDIISEDSTDLEVETIITTDTLTSFAISTALNTARNSRLQVVLANSDGESEYYHLDTIDMPIGFFFEMKPDSIVIINSLDTLSYIDFDSLYIPSNADNLIYRVYFDIGVNHLELPSQFLELRFDADWNIRTRLDMLTMKHVGVSDYYLDTKYTIEGIYPEGMSGFNQKIGMKGYHSGMLLPKNHSIQIDIQDSLQYIEIEYHASFTGVRDEFYFNMDNIALTKYYMPVLSDINDRTSIKKYDLNDIRVKAVHSLLGDIIQFDTDQSLIKLVSQLEDGIYLLQLVSSSEQGLIIITEDQQLTGYKLIAITL